MVEVRFSSLQRQFTAALLAIAFLLPINAHPETVVVSVQSGALANGTIFPTGSQSANQGETLSYTVTPNAGLYATYLGTCRGTLVGNVFTTLPLVSDCTVTFSFGNKVTYALYPQAAQEVPPIGTAALADGSAVVDPASKTIDVSVNFAYLTDAAQPTSISLHGPAQRGEIGPIKATLSEASNGVVRQLVSYAPSDEADILSGKWYLNIATPARPTGELRAQLDNIGTGAIPITVVINGTGTGTVTSNDINCPGDCTGEQLVKYFKQLKANPNFDSRLLSLTDSTGYCVGTNSTCTVGHDDFGPNTVTATFSNIFYASPSAVGNGTVSPNTMQGIAYGNALIFAVTPEPNYRATVTGTCGGSLTGTTYTTLPVTADCTVEVSFTLKTYVVTPMPGFHGAILPATPQTITHGDIAVFSVIPDAGYSVAVNGSCGGSLIGTSFSTAPITADCDLSALFTFIPVPPGAPTITTISVGSSQVTVHFSSPSVDGGSPITSFTATCGTQSNSGVNSPITVAGLANFIEVNCSVVAINGAGTSIPSATMQATPLPPIALRAATSLKDHGVGQFNLNIDVHAPIDGAVTVEPRAIGAGHQVIFDFNVPITSLTSVAALSETGQSVGAAIANFIGSNVIVTLTGIADNQRVRVLAVGVNGPNDFEIAIGFLVGDVNSSRSVDLVDVGAIKARSGEVANPANSKYDLNASGKIGATDILIAKRRAGLALP